MTEFSLSFNNLKGIPFDKYEKKFTFIVDNKPYETTRIIADLLSPNIRHYHYIDKTVDTFIIKTSMQKEKQQISASESKDYFSDFLKLTEFDCKMINEEQRKYYIEYFFQLGNIDEYLRLQPDISEEESIDNVIDHLEILIKIVKQQNIKEILNNEKFRKIINYASSHFSEISKEKIERLPIEIIAEMMNEETLKIDDEDSLLNFIIELYLKDDKYSILFEYVKFQNLTEEGLTRFIEVFSIEDINSSIWKSICERLLEKVTPSNKERYNVKCKEFKHQANNEFHGIMRYLTDETNGNIHENGTIEITSNSIVNDDMSYHPKSAVDYQKDNFYFSKDDLEDATVCFDFKDKSIQLSEYTIKTFNGGENHDHLRNWVVEVSNDNEKWEIVDRHENDSTLRGRNIIATFKAKETSNFYRFVRIRQTGKSWNDSYYFIFYFIEFYGKLKEPSKK